MISGGEEMKFDEKIAKHMEDLAKGITSVTNSVKEVDDKLESVKRDNDSIKVKLDARNEPEDDEEDSLDDLLDDPKVVKARLKEDIKAEIRNEIGAELNAGKLQEQWDARAYQEFPDLKDQNTVFYKETKKEMGNLFPVGYDKMNKPIYSPDAVYNAAARVKLRGQKEGWVPLVIVEDETLDAGGSYKRSIKGKGMTEIQRDLCALWSVDPKRVESRIKGGR